MTGEGNADGGSVVLGRRAFATGAQQRLTLAGISREYHAIVHDRRAVVGRAQRAYGVSRVAIRFMPLEALKFAVILDAEYEIGHFAETVEPSEDE